MTRVSNVKNHGHVSLLVSIRICLNKKNNFYFKNNYAEVDDYLLL